MERDHSERLISALEQIADHIRDFMETDEPMSKRERYFLALLNGFASAGSFEWCRDKEKNPTLQDSVDAMKTVVGICWVLSSFAIAEAAGRAVQASQNQAASEEEAKGH